MKKPHETRQIKCSYVGVCEANTSIADKLQNIISEFKNVHHFDRRLEL